MYFRKKENAKKEICDSERKKNASYVLCCVPVAGLTLTLGNQRLGRMMTWTALRREVVEAGEKR